MESSVWFNRRESMFFRLSLDPSIREASAKCNAFATGAMQIAPVAFAFNYAVSTHLHLVHRRLHLYLHLIQMHFIRIKKANQTHLKRYTN